jgi:hypothetical protein
MSNSTVDVIGQAIEYSVMFITPEAIIEKPTIRTTNMKTYEYDG